MQLKKCLLPVGILAASFALLTFGFSAFAVDVKTDPSGTWIWGGPGRKGNPGSTNALILKLAGNVLSGTFKAPERGGKSADCELTDAKFAQGTRFAGGKLSFKVKVPIGTNTFIRSYSGTLNGSTIDGNMTLTLRNGTTHNFQWHAKRQQNSTTKP